MQQENRILGIFIRYSGYRRANMSVLLLVNEGSSTILDDLRLFVRTSARFSGCHAFIYCLFQRSSRNNKPRNIDFSHRSYYALNEIFHSVPSPAIRVTISFEIDMEKRFVHGYERINDAIFRKRFFFN